MVQKKPPRSIPRKSGLLDGPVKRGGVWPAVSDHLVVLDDQTDTILAGSPESLFQHHTVVTGVHTSGPLSCLRRFRPIQHIRAGPPQKSRIPVLPRKHELTPGEWIRSEIAQDGTRRKRYGNFLAFRPNQRGRNGSPEAVSRAHRISPSN